jgi:hypothetical protein
LDVNKKTLTNYSVDCQPTTTKRKNFQNLSDIVVFPDKDITFATKLGEFRGHDTGEKKPWEDKSLAPLSMISKNAIIFS